MSSKFPQARSPTEITHQTKEMALQLDACLHVRVGCWAPIQDPKDPTVVQIGKYAIDEHNKQAKTKLKFQNVVEGEKQPVGGLNYKLVVDAVDGSASNQYEAVVYVRAGDMLRKLTSFKKLN